ncbi:GTP-binding protein [Aquisalimonas sp. 2447]|uniref:CobW family GTP-binding protein n=1 Tax=Aquisalimonas sp. 2447 TaxID=2740807 RepID=UPI0014326D9C|nr:CobW family GTP-binding protein [Aquisalimonas sp. 2447]QIT55144.1 GTP-binding protein [Aquisalimonas sp. 2447]
MSRQRITDVPTNLITGFLGVGKTTAVRALLNGAPANERWAVLVNEFGQIGVDAAAVAPEHGEPVIRELPGGCLCCTMGAPLQVTLTRLLREALPDRLLIEPTGVGHPARVLDTLRGEGLAEALDVRATVCLVDPRRLDDEWVTSDSTFQDQVEMADVLVGNKQDLCDEAALQRFRDWGATLYPSKAVVATTENGALDPEWLDVQAGSGRVARHPEAHHDHGHVHGHVHGAEDTGEPRPGLPVRVRDQGQGLDACGWRFHPGDVFDADRLAEVLRGIHPSQRVKGVFRCDDGWLLFDRAEGALSVRLCAWRTDSRVECIAGAGAAPDWEQVEQDLLAARLEQTSRTA